MVDLEKQRLLPPPPYSPRLCPEKTIISSKTGWSLIAQKIIRVIRLIVIIPYVSYLYNYFGGDIQVTGNAYIPSKLLAILLFQMLQFLELYLHHADGILWPVIHVSASVLIILMPILALLNSVPLEVWLASMGSYLLMIIDYILHLFITPLHPPSNQYGVKIVSAILTCMWCTLGLFKLGHKWNGCLFLAMMIWSGSQLLIGVGIKALFMYYK